MKLKLHLVLVIASLWLVATNAQAQYSSNNTVKVNFASTDKLREVTWEPNAVLNPQGLFIELLPSSHSAEVWVKTQPIPVGLSFRPATSVSISVTIQAKPDSFSFLRANFRYSCDRVHWSTWYNLSDAKSADKNNAYTFDGWLTIPNAARENYSSLAREWWKTSPAWSSDEHELCGWIAKKHPTFFATEFPFIGYVQVQIEGETQGMLLQSITVNTHNTESGLTSGKNGAVRDTINEKWFFDLSKTSK